MFQLHLSYWINSIYTEHCPDCSQLSALSESARIVKSARFAKAAADQGQTAHVTCRARGAPGVTFSWSRAGDVIDDAASAGKYSIERKRVRDRVPPPLQVKYETDCARTLIGTVISRNGGVIEFILQRFNSNAN